MFEACALKISINKMKLCTLCLYRPPDGDFNQFIDQLNSILLFLESTKLESIISGDTNVNYPLKVMKKKKQLQSLLDIRNLVQSTFQREQVDLYLTDI